MKITPLLRKQVLLITSILLTFGCSTGPEDGGSNFETKPYFDLQGMINHQINLLDSLKPEVQQSGMVNNKKEEKKIRMDSAQWEEALYLFKEADINKPVLKDSYTIKDSSLQSTQRVKIYRAKQSSLPVRNMKVFYQDSLKNPSAISIDYKENTYLNYNQKHLRMEFSHHDQHHILNRYYVRAKQKLIFQDTIAFENEGIIIFN